MLRLECVGGGVRFIREGTSIRERVGEGRVARGDMRQVDALLGLFLVLLRTGRGDLSAAVVDPSVHVGRIQRASWRRAAWRGGRR